MGAAGGKDALRALADDQRLVLALLADGATLDEVATELAYSRRTVTRRLTAARAALGVKTTAEALTLLGASPRD